MNAKCKIDVNPMLQLGQPVNRANRGIRVPVVLLMFSNERVVAYLLPIPHA